ncbi:FAD-binding oxidoreductase [Roseomonas xinghualingensis]|uniref:FAD-binding oxidoreductase n=1 Tax=Roseomonas xinghualingensis TaxID=2986475 RepID=UPI0021F178EA|nr:FAD-binding oxidoreductase [Roseomonas sp. SXEYE001]MCV4209804.1 FAD-binding oxidoreductase [Roseomonas sp. SXEYE001]
MTDALIASLTEAVGADHILTGEATAPYLTDWRKLVTGSARAVVRPTDCAQVSAVLRACAAHGSPVVPQGGNTGQVAGAVPGDDGRAVVLSLTRLNRVRAIDLDNDTITVEAGCILQSIQQAAEAAGRLFPLSLGAEGSCMIGGNLGSNAGGTTVLRYGNARELCLGLEVVLADGEVWHGLRGLRKDNSGYDLRDLFIGSEGTLGIITAATMKLFPQPAARCTALAALSSIHNAGRFLTRARARFHASLTGFELMSVTCLRLVSTFYPQHHAPFARLDDPWYVLLEISDAESEECAVARLEAVLVGALEAGEIADVAIAQNMTQARAMWHMRESITLALAADGKCIKHDVSLPVSAVPGFVERTDAALQAAYPGVRNFTFGHLGDGNLHYNVARPADGTDAQLHAMQPRLSELVHDAIVELDGSISAEQGIGRLRTQDLARYKQPVALRMMRAVKQALDPHGLLNPGVLLP